VWCLSASELPCSLTGPVSERIDNISVCQIARVRWSNTAECRGAGMPRPPLPGATPTVVATNPVNTHAPVGAGSHACPRLSTVTTVFVVMNDTMTDLFVGEGHAPPVGWLSDGRCINRPSCRTDGGWIRCNGRGMPLPYR